MSDVNEEAILKAKTQLKAAKYSAAFISKIIKIGKSMFRLAVRRGVLTKNPAEEIAAGQQVNRDRNRFIPADVINKLIDSIPDHEPLAKP